MSWLEALILGIVQGLTEFLPVSSSGHLTILSNLFGLEGESNLTMIVVLHVATVLSTLVILWNEVVWIFKDLFTKQSWKSYSGLNEGTQYAINILISMIPVGIVGFFFKDAVEEIFGSGLLIVGIMLLVTAALLAFSYYAKPRQREKISPLHAFIIGIGQAVAVMPGLSRSGTTIATGLLLGNKKEKMAQFSFLMVIPPVLGEALLDVKDIAEQGFSTAMSGISAGTMIVGFLAAFITGCLACKWMINVVKRGKLIWFAVYCVIVGLFAIIYSQLC
ncbi:MAG: undecaprenyl-diphosphate phosphatase [Bacteroidales bacterium]|jgi:undecaprenyl-diphosphatase|nr:undecaprenyl-diphosphate phosphatase [Bacteroidales bacterium]